MSTLEQDRAWLADERTLDELRTRFPDEWQRVRARLIEAGDEGRPGIRRLLSEYTPSRTGARDRAAGAGAEVRLAVRRRMVQQALRGWSDRTESGVEQGTIRFRRFDGLVLQRVLFRRGLERKPVRMLPFRAAWRLAAQRDRLMPLVRQRGVYCFYSAALLRRLRTVADGAPVLEIAAGDGTLTRMLRGVGVDARATDDHSWAHRIDFADQVERLDARAALKRYRPAVVVCSWPPAGNDFERHVFASADVLTYVVITSSDPSEAGDERAYRTQSAFALEEDARLDGLVLPPGRNRVLVFRRIAPGPSA